MACFRDDNGQAITAARHHELMVFVLDRDYLGFTTINAPPGFAKTYWINFWLVRKLALEPTTRVIYVSATEQHALKQSVMVRDTFTSNPAFRALYPEAQKDPDKAWGATKWFLKRGVSNDPNPSYSAFGLDGQVLGSRADLLILDDINTQEQIRSTIQREKVAAWIGNTGRSRLVPERGRLINCQTRWHQLDATGYALDEHWTQLRFQALAENDGPNQFGVLTVFEERKKNRVLDDLARDGWAFEVDEVGLEESKDHHWEIKIFLHANGPSLWPERFAAYGDSDSALDRIRTSLGPRDWASTYQSLPVPEGGAIFDTRAFNLYPWAERVEVRKGPFVLKVSSFDTSYGKNSQGDYSVGTTWGLKRDGSMWLLDMFRGRPAFPELKEVMLTQFLMHSPNVVLIEDAASGQSLIQELKAGGDDRLYRIPVVAVPPRLYGSDKVSRAHSVTGYVAAGKIYIPADAPWSGEFISEMGLFPNATHDDIVDSVTYAIRRMIQAASSTAIEEQGGERDTFFGSIIQQDDVW